MSWRVDHHGYLKELSRRISRAEKRCSKFFESSKYDSFKEANENFGIYSDILNLGKEYNRIAKSQGYDRPLIDTESMTKKLMKLQEIAEDGLLACDHYL